METAPFPAPSALDDGPALLVITRSSAAAGLLARYMRGCRTIVAQDLAQARDTAQRVQPQMVVVDRALGEVDPAKLDELAREWGLPRTPFVVTPLPGEEPLRQRLAVEGYLIKPISRDRLWDVLRQFSESIDRVLVIDDDQDFVRLVSRLLDSPIRRYQVATALSGQEGLAMMRHHQPDLVLLDLGLPDLDGTQMIERIRDNPLWRRIPIVIVSAQDEMDSSIALEGQMIVGKAGGLRPGEVVQWVQDMLDSTTRIWF
jgi:CheY-like chemotaxis protein